jgi:hypothetical protein
VGHGAIVGDGVARAAMIKPEGKCDMGKKNKSKIDKKMKKLKKAMKKAKGTKVDRSENPPIGQGST